MRPDSIEARYNYALALKRNNRPLDAAGELEKLLAANEKDVRAHLLLGNLCADQLQQPARARTHYARVLELEPKYPQAATILYWLKMHPPK